MYKYFIIFCCFVLAGCSSGSRIDKGEATTETLKESVLPDSIFYGKGITEFKASHAVEILKVMKKPLVKISDDLRGKLIECLSKNEQILDAYYYSNYDDIDGITRIALLISTVESNSFVFLTINKGLEIVSCKKLTEDNCSLVDQDDEKEVVWCDTKEAYVGDHGLRLIKKHSEQTHFGSYSTTKKDSITFIYKIDEKGLLLLTQKDSTRIESP